MSASDDKGQTWWVTGFDRNNQNVKANDLTATFTLDFKDQPGLYEAFYKSWGNGQSNDDGYAWDILGKNRVSFTFK